MAVNKHPRIKHSQFWILAVVEAVQLKIQNQKPHTIELC